jgi:epoxide hydrolase
VPTGVLVSLGSDVAIRRFAERDHHVVHWSELDRGGHFFALEQPELFVADLREFFGGLTE